MFLPLITTNCVFSVWLSLLSKKDYDLLTGVVYAFSTALGFGLALTLFAGLREQMSLVSVPKGMQGTPIALITAGLLAMAFMGFSGGCEDFKEEKTEIKWKGDKTKNLSPLFLFFINLFPLHFVAYLIT